MVSVDHKPFHCLEACYKSITSSLKLKYFASYITVHFISIVCCFIILVKQSSVLLMLDHKSCKYVLK